MSLGSFALTVGLVITTPMSIYEGRHGRGVVVFHFLLSHALVCVFLRFGHVTHFRKRLFRIHPSNPHGASKLGSTLSLRHEIIPKLTAGVRHKGFLFSATARKARLLLFPIPSQPSA